MSLNPKKSPLIVALCYSCFVMGIALAHPFWDINKDWAKTYKGDGQEVVEWIGFMVEVGYPTAEIIAFHKYNIVRLLVAATIGAVIGLLVHRAIWGKRPDTI